MVTSTPRIPVSKWSLNSALLNSVLANPTQINAGQNLVDLRDVGQVPHGERGWRLRNLCQGLQTWAPGRGELRLWHKEVALKVTIIISPSQWYMIHPYIQSLDSYWPIVYNWSKNSGEPLGATGSPWSCQQSNWRFLDQQKIKLKTLKSIGNDDCRPIPPWQKAELIQAEGVRFLLLFSPPYIRPITKYHIPQSRLKTSLFPFWRSCKSS